MNLLCEIRAVNVPYSLAHKSRAEEIKTLSDYIEVSVAGVDSLNMMNIGDSTPSTDMVKHPWLVLDGDGNPIDIRYYVGGSWVSAIDTDSQCRVNTGTDTPATDDQDKAWSDVTNGTIKMWTGAEWEIIANVGSIINTGTSTPDAADQDKLWNDVTNGELKMWNGASWEVIAQTT